MPTLALVKGPPKGRHWKVEVDGRNFETEAELLESVRTNSRGNVVYMKTNFKDPKNYRHYPSRQRNFRDGYFVYTFWFVRMQDAAMMKLMAA